ncbi:Thioredoxin-like I protein Txl1 [Schizosaccharomyces pombe]|uniref:Thioredoxin-like protein 1 n=1 Tax=Schizosaccharomyces pombe (strain 972 / ATCC 24843) TaxID=284812 RepID=TXL1_SCHPO|nr:thioredoxin-1-like protein Txl1 [Schizosaccharomyces pombe]Q9USR1.1 RecName: Full=Thioredoxin-like protein 1; AltName: Full=Thioredoxin homolog 3 [Schizosaccharomyces pombe 972h-]ABD47124.1 thioredoxin [Schizosaccharomyces pombe]CAB54816.1 thioredoxin-like I protein Txl1 [Schizosaccharomyces pombe]|eukprot:NP_595306.1 thioredoxin-1-like protein Txl1 [Schizosaccharomyces pombe]
MSVIEIRSYQHWISTIPKSGYLAVDCYADWCGPCKAISPLFSQLASKYASPKFVFAKVNVDEQRQIASGLGVKAMPTFVFFENGKQIDMLTGANPQALKEKVALISSKATGTGALASSSSAPVKGFASLQGCIENPQLECLNQQDDHDLKSAFNSNPSSFLESDVDEQLMIYIPFLEVVKVHSIAITPVKGETSSAPKTIKLYINQPNNLSFEDAESFTPTQVIEDIVYEQDDQPTIIPLRFVKFQRVNSLVIFIYSNVGEEETTKISRLELFGEPVGDSSKGKLQKVEA